MLKALKNLFKPKLNLVDSDTNNITIKIIEDPVSGGTKRHQILGISHERSEELYKICSETMSNSKHKDIISVCAEISTHCKHVNEVYFCCAYIEIMNSKISNSNNLLQSLMSGV